ncbi:MAG: hypothetical protein IPL32_15170 [Chloracidobacterium sp.]|nr:hypothetical protein [Chloracidobacterium sp.]
MCVEAIEEESQILYTKGVEFKEIARKEVHHLDNYIQAATRFSEAATKLEYLTNTNQPIDFETQYFVYSNYYRFEENDCLAAYFYEKRDTDKTEEFRNKANEHLKKCLCKLENLPQGLSTEVRDTLGAHIPKWKYFLRSSEISDFANKARKSFDNYSFVEALDCYREMIRLEEINLELIDGLFDPQHGRIARGRALGSHSNASAAIALIMIKRLQANGDYGALNLPFNSLVEVLQHEKNAFLFGMEAFRQNPEWQQYYDISQGRLENIKEALRSNASDWNKLYLAFENDPDLLGIMKQTDLELYKKAEANRVFKENKYFKLWAVGSFWLFVLVVVVGLVLLIQNFSSSWGYFLVTLVGVEVFFLLIGAFILRSVGDLSEAKFLELVKMALQFQFNIFSASKDDKAKLDE